jgi:2-keto-4-pentenoate hydratase
LHSIITTEEAIAEKLVAARLGGAALARFPGEAPRTLKQAYCIQDFAIARVADVIAGWKVGRNFPPHSINFGSDRLAGPIFKKLVQVFVAPSPDQFKSLEQKPPKPLVGSVYRGGFGAVEAEFLLRLGAAPNVGQMKYSLGEAAALIDAVHVGIEIASSPMATINDFGPAITISDFGNNNGLIVGGEILDWRTSDFSNWIVSTAVDDVEVGRGSASVFPDGPIGSVRFLLELMAERGITLAAGTWVSSGAITGVHNVRKGQRVKASFSSNLNVSCVVAEVPCIVDKAQTAD